MRKVLKNHDEVAHYWANKIQPQGEAGNMYFRDDRIYSYGAHFCIARHLPGGAVAFTTRGYSNSTGKHKHITLSAVRHLRVVYCRDPADDARANMQAARERIRDELAFSERARIRQTTRDAHKAAALHIAENANAYLAALPEDERQGQQPVDTSALEAVRAALVAAEEAAARVREEQHAARLVDLQESLAKWRTGEVVVRTGLHSLPVALRIRWDGAERLANAMPTAVAIQTSHGAEIPVDEAPRIWRSVQAARTRGVEYVPQDPAPAIGVYRLTRIRADGSMVVGCHDIPYSELEMIARELGYTVDETAEA